MKFYTICLVFLISMTQSFNSKAQATPDCQVCNRYILTEEPDNFRTVFFDRSVNKLYMGGVNKMYEFDPENVTRALRIEIWNPDVGLVSTCLNFKSDPNLCQNNIRAFVSINNTHLYACGTMAFLPRCAYILKENFKRIESITETGRWKTPRDPYVSSVSVVANQTLFTATRGSIHGHDSIISRTLNGATLRTKSNDRFWLNDPHFISGYSVPDADPLQSKVMLFFREKAEEFQPFKFGMSSRPNDRNVVSRVATVCANDHGGSAYILNRRFATYVKKTIVCNAPGSSDDETTFQYTHLESTFELPDETNTGGSTIYGIFTMPNNAIAGSAICAYKVNDIRSQISANRYWNRDLASEGLKTAYEGDPVASPGTCVQETTRLSQSRLTFGDNHPIKFGYLQRSQDTPFYQESGTRFSHIAVDHVPRESSALGTSATVLYMITATGMLKRIVFTEADAKFKNRTLPDIQILKFQPSEIVIKMEIGNGYLYVVTNITVVQMPLASCNIYSNCDECKDSHDPYCTINQNGNCQAFSTLSPSDMKLFPNLTLSCPRREEIPVGEVTEGNHLIEELQQNVLVLTQRNAETLQALQEMENKKAQALSQLDTCNGKLAEEEDENSQLSDALSESQQSYLAARLAHNKTLTDFEHCVGTRKFFMDHAIRLALEIRNRPSQEEVNQQLNQVNQAREGAMLQLRDCQNERRSITNKIKSCNDKLKTVTGRLLSANASCEESLTNQQNDFDAEIASMSQKLVTMRDDERQAAIHMRNITEFEMNKKLRACRERGLRITYSNADAIKNNKLLRREIAYRQNEIRRLNGTFRRYRNQHTCIDGGRWFVSNSTGNMYNLVEELETFDEAERNCRAMNSSLAVFSNDEEPRYISNLIHNYEPSHYYWIGLVKNTDGSMRWQDGTAVAQHKNRFINAAKTNRNRVTFCAEVGGSENWELVDCTKRRRYICQKNRETATTQQTTATPLEIQ